MANLSASIRPSERDEALDAYQSVFELLDAMKTSRLEHLALWLEDASSWRADDFVRATLHSRAHSTALRIVEVTVNEADLFSGTTQAALSSLASLERMVVLFPGVVIDRNISLPTEHHNIRTLHLKQCNQFTRSDIDWLLRQLVESAKFPKFEELVIERCVNLTVRDLAGIHGVEYVLWED